MNTTKLHIIAKSLLEELQRTNAVALLQQICEGLQNQVNQPQQANHQKQVSDHLQQLYENLEGSPVDEYSPAWRDVISEMGMKAEFGSNLMNEIKEIFQTNTITPQTALEEMKKYYEDIQGTHTNLNQLAEALEYFSVGEDVLEPNECEVGIVVPRSFVEDNLKKFGTELIKLEKSLLVFSELATGRRDPLTIRQISSSELSIFIQYLPEIGACIAIAVERIVALYKQILEIKKLRNELSKQEVPDDKLNGITEYAESVISPKLDEIAEELVEKFGEELQRERKNEIKTELRFALNALANRIDRGFNVEIRVAPLKEADESDGEEKESDEQHSEMVKQIIDSASKIEYLEHGKEPVLYLPEYNNDDQISKDSE